MVLAWAKLKRVKQLLCTGGQRNAALTGLLLLGLLFHLDFRGFQAVSEEQRQKSHTLHIRSNDIICIVTSDVQTHLEIRALRVFVFLYFSDGSDETIKS